MSPNFVADFQKPKKLAKALTDSMAQDKRLTFAPAFYARFPLVSLSKKALDQAMETGYYRNGSEFFTTSARHMGQNWVPSIMLRLPINGFEFKKRHKKLLRVNQKSFKHVVKAFAPCLEKELLWQRFKSGVHKWQFIPKLEHHLFRDKPPTNFHAMELSVFHGEKLVAFTAFDLGETSLSSLEAAYDPDYGQYSLGFYTMLLEIEYCRDNQLSHYYPGFLPKDDSMFAYKLRPGEMEYFQLKSAQWKPISGLQKEDWLMENVVEKNDSLKAALQAAGFFVINGYAYCLHVPSKKALLQASNLNLLVPIQGDFGTSLLVVYWDELSGGYKAFEGEDVFPELQPNPIDSHLFFHVYQKNYFGQFSQEEDVVLLAKEFGSYLYPKG